jgi:hypothetical protein
MLVAIEYVLAQSDEWMYPACNGPEHLVAIVASVAVEGVHEDGTGGF